MTGRFRKGAESDTSNMSMSDHLRELRRRLFISLIAVAVAIVPAWFLYPWLVDFLNEPYCTAQQALDAGANCDFLETDIVEPFSLRIRIEAILHVEPISEPVAFDAGFDLGGGGLHIESFE